MSDKALIEAAKEKHVVGLSGGKDSTALALWLVENEPREYEFICNETGNELPEMVAHWDRLEQMLGAPLERVRHSTDLFGLIDEQKMLPNFRSRFCTRILKIEPTIRYMDSLPDGSTLYVGLRADEEMRRGIYGEDMLIRFPLREQGFTEEGVWRFLEDRKVTIPARTDCALCYHQRVEEWQSLYFEHPGEWQKGVEIEAKYGHTFRSPGRDTWPVGLKEMGEEFASGRQPRKSSRTTACRVCRL